MTVSDSGTPVSNNPTGFGKSPQLKCPHPSQAEEPTHTHDAPQRARFHARHPAGADGTDAHAHGSHALRQPAAGLRVGGGRLRVSVRFSRRLDLHAAGASTRHGLHPHTHLEAYASTLRLPPRAA